MNRWTIASSCPWGVFKNVVLWTVSLKIDTAAISSAISESSSITICLYKIIIGFIQELSLALYFSQNTYAELVSKRDDLTQVFNCLALNFILLFNVLLLCRRYIFLKLKWKRFWLLYPSLHLLICLSEQITQRMNLGELLVQMKLFRLKPINKLWSCPATSLLVQTSVYTSPFPLRV